MVVYFRKMNNLFMLIGGIVGATAGYLVFKGKIFGDGNIINIFLFAMFLAAGIIIGRTAAAFTANKRLQEIYRILYRDADPKRFIDRFTPLLETVPKNLAEYMTGCQHLSFAREALGEFKEAYDLIKDLKPEELRLHALTTTSLITNQKANLCVLMKDEESARALISDLASLRESASKRAPMLANNLSECIKLHNTRLDAMEGNPDADTGYLEEEIRVSTNVIHQKEIQLELSRFLRGQGQAEHAQELLREILSDRRGLYTEEKAQELLAS